jgi:hypothetical protein
MHYEEESFYRKIFNGSPPQSVKALHEEASLHLRMIVGGNRTMSEDAMVVIAVVAPRLAPAVELRASPTEQTTAVLNAPRRGRPPKYAPVMES